MLHLEQLLKPTWVPEKWLNIAWSILEEDEQLLIKQRLDDMFHNGLPFQLEHDKILYLYLFSLLAQLEILGLQGLLSSLKKLSGTPLQHTMREQIKDEIFHAMTFAKISYQLSAPYALPPTYNKNIEKLMTLFIDEPDLRTTLVLVNLFGEGWIEEVFLAMKNNKIASRVFEVVLEDESRHLEESDLYLKTGLPDENYLRKRLECFEEGLIACIFAQPKNVISFANMLGIKAMIELINNIDKKHRALLSKINLQPSEKWQSSIKTTHLLIERFFHDQIEDMPVALSTTRKMLIAQWGEPNHPTQSTVFGINVSAIGFFEKKFSSDTINCLFLQVISKVFMENPFLKNYICHHKIYNSHNMYVGLAVRLPGCTDQLGMIEFKNCHNMSLLALSQHIENDIKIMLYCHNKTEELKAEHPYLMDLINELLSPNARDDYANPFLARPTISISNIGHWGYEVNISPLFPNETMKFTLGKIERKQVWNNSSKSFEIQDILPVGVSADHRVFDANIPMPFLIQTAFNDMFTLMLQTFEGPEATITKLTDLNKFIKGSDQLLKTDLEFGFRNLFVSSQVWKNQHALFC